MGFSTDAIHAGQAPDPQTGAVVLPLVQSTTFAQEAPGQPKKYEYGRTGNPTREALEANIAALEQGRYGFAFASGMAATAAVCHLLRPGDHVIATANLYGGTYRYFEQVMRQFGLSFSYADTSNLEAIEDQLRPSTRMLFVETPTNPLLILSDIRALAGFCRENGLLLVVDNTFLSPYFQRPLTLGADIVIHSSTKYIGGHSDIIGGLVVVREAMLAEQLAFYQNAAGAVPSPYDCWLTLRSVKTLALRMRQHDANARTIATFLHGHPAVRKVYYPGLKNHPQYRLARRQQKDPAGRPGFGGMISLELENEEKARLFLSRLRIFTLAESLGAVESLVCHPATMTHASIPPAEREKIGLSDSLVRLSIGIEDVEDLLEDLRQALDGL
jgi:cystathionine beta-lyase/cystathionine gamma-synthase